MLGLKPIKLLPARERVASAIREAIIQKKIKEGEILTLDTTAQELGVSVTPVREALILLEYQGLVDRLPNNHVRVSQLSEEYFQKIFEMFLQMEQDAFLYVIKEKDELPEDEMNFHRFLYENYPYSFQKKSMETVVEIYLSFAINSYSYNKENWTELSKAIKDFQSEKDQNKLHTALEQYYKEILKTIMKESV